MPRSPVTTRPAVPGDIPVLVGLWRELRQVGARTERAVNPAAVPDVADRLLEVIADEECRIVLAEVDGQPAGMAVLRAARPDPMSVHRVVQMIHVVVASGMRRRGVGHALLDAAADFADERQIEHLSAGMYPSLRDASRFYARLGFAPVLVQRVAPVTMLRRALGTESGSRFEDLVRRRSRGRRAVPAQRMRVRSGEPVD